MPSFAAASNATAALLRREQRALVVFLLSAIVFALGTHRVVFASGNDASRWAHMEALVDHHTGAIDQSRFAATVDRDILDGRSYSNKPPLFAMLGAGVYFLLQQLFGWSFAQGVGMANIVHVVTFCMVGVPTAALLAIFDRKLRRSGAAAVATLLTLGLGGGTILGSFAVTLNNHNLAAALLFGAWLRASQHRGLSSGVLVGLATAIDILPGAGFVPTFAVTLFRRGDRRALVRYGAGVVFALAIFVGANLATSGTILPPRFSPGARPAVVLGPEVRGVVLPQRWSYFSEVLLGGHGLLSVSPILLFGALGLAGAVRSRNTRRVALPLAVGVGLQVLGHGLLAGSYGGWSYGFRYLIPIIPLLLAHAPRALRPGYLYKAFLLFLPISLLTAALGAYHPWPPAYEQESFQVPIASTLVTNPVGGNAACWAEQHWPDSRLARGLGGVFVSADREEQRSYCRLFFLSKSDFVTARRYGPTNWRP